MTTTSSSRIFDYKSSRGGWSDDADLPRSDGGRDELLARARRGGPNQTEALLLDDHKRKVEADCHSSLQASIATLRETEVTGAHTLSTMEAQGDQIIRMQKRMDDIETNMQVSDRLLRSMGSWFGALSNSFRTRPEPVHTPMTRATRAASVPETRWGAEERNPVAAAHHQKLQGLDEDEPFADELNQISSSLAVLKAMGTTMSSELDDQHKNIGILTSTVDRVDAHITRNRGAIRRID